MEGLEKSRMYQLVSRRFGPLALGVLHSHSMRRFHTKISEFILLDHILPRPKLVLQEFGNFRLSRLNG
jgi:hypothetical protein